jgi:hypothetical protein
MNDLRGFFNSYNAQFGIAYRLRPTRKWRNIIFHSGGNIEDVFLSTFLINDKEAESEGKFDVESTLNMIFSVIKYFMSWYLWISEQNIVMDVGCVLPLAKTPTFSCQQVVIMDDWNLDEKTLGKWQYLQHYKYINLPKIARNEREKTRKTSVSGGDRRELSVCSIHSQSDAQGMINNVGETLYRGLQ